MMGGMIALGVLFGSRRMFIRALLLLLLVGTWNSVLKQWFAWPWFTPYGGYGFPSGHTHALTIVYGYLLGCTKRLWGLGIGLALILCAGAGMVYFEDHRPLEVLGGFLFGVMELLMVLWLDRYDYAEWVLTALACLFVGLWLNVTSPIHTCIWEPFICLIGVITGLALRNLVVWVRILGLELLCIALIPLQLLGYDWRLQFHTPSTYIALFVFGFIFTCLPSLRCALNRK